MNAHIVAIAARTPLGLTAGTAAAAVRARISRLTFHPFAVDAADQRVRSARDPRLDPALFGPLRLQTLATLTLPELLGKLPRSRRDVALELALALPEPRPGFASSDGGAILEALAAQLRPHDGALETRVLEAGHAGVLAGLADALRAIDQGSEALFLVGGVDSYFADGTLAWLERERRLRTAGVSDGLSPGEGAGFVAVASDSVRRRLGLPSLARVLGAAKAIEPRSWDDDAGLLGEGLAEAIRGATARFSGSAQRVGDIYCDVNGERLRSDDWGSAILRTPHLFDDASLYTSCAGEWGDTGAATGALSCALAVESFLRGHARTPRTLLCGSSWAGLRAACLLLAEEQS